MFHAYGCVSSAAAIAGALLRRCRRDRCGLASQQAACIHWRDCRYAFHAPYAQAAYCRWGATCRPAADLHHSPLSHCLLQRTRWGAQTPLHKHTTSHPAAAAACTCDLPCRSVTPPLAFPQEPSCTSSLCIRRQLLLRICQRRLQRLDLVRAAHGKHAGQHLQHTHQVAGRQQQAAAREATAAAAAVAGQSTAAEPRTRKQNQH